MDEGNDDRAGSNNWSELRKKLETEIDQIASQQDFTFFLNRHGIGIISSDEWANDSVLQIQMKLRDKLAENDEASGGPGMGISEMEKQASQYAKENEETCDRTGTTKLELSSKISSPVHSGPSTQGIWARARTLHQNFPLRPLMTMNLT